MNTDEVLDALGARADASRLPGMARWGSRLRHQYNRRDNDSLKAAFNVDPYGT